ncbi:MAG: TrkA C-terminal domain-containing protein [Lachnospiraceae bacterium]|nr:TrkA C-terminal domain-containing protein [Lachnospiraceae bacterium]
MTLEYGGRLHIEGVYRNNELLDANPDLIIKTSDIIVVAGAVRDIDRFNKNGLVEMTDEK